MAASRHQTLIDRLEIVDVLYAMAYADDDRDWKRLRSLMADSVYFDMSRHLGTPAQDFPADELVKMMQATLEGFQSTQHIISNVMATIEGDVARGRASVIAYHYLPTEKGIADYCTLRGYMEVELQRAGEGWLFRKIAIVPTAPLEGYPGLYGLAAKKAAAAAKEVQTEQM